MKLEDQMRFHEMQAYWWIHAASNGHAATRTIRHGGPNGRLFTENELRDDAMKTAQRHMRIFSELAEADL